MNKKGIMLHFILSLVVAILFFAVGFGVVNKVFSTSEQALQNFMEFNKEIEDFAGNEKVKTSFIMTLDANTGVLIFDDKEKLFVTKTAETGNQVGILGGTKRKTINLIHDFPYPEKNCEGKVPCSCLCREFKLQGLPETDLPEGFNEVSYLAKCEPGRLVCEERSDLKLKEDQLNILIHLIKRKLIQVFTEIPLIS